MKRMLFSALAAVLIAAAGFSFAAAQEPEAPQPGRRGFGFGGPRGGGPGIARLADLTEEQRTQVRDILRESDAERAARQGVPASVTAHRELQAELLADVPDEQKIDTLRQQLAEAHAASLQREIALQRKIAQILTPEQRAKARERLAEAPQPRVRGERGARREG